MKKISALITGCLFCSISLAQNSRIWATYYGGSSNDGGATEGICNTVDHWGNVYLGGSTPSYNNIASGGFQDSLAGGYDGFLVKFDASGNRLWGTYYGGINEEDVTSVATDLYGNVYLAGSTSATSGIAFNGFQNTFGGAVDVFIVKFDSAGNRLWATYYGGPGGESIPSVVLDSSGNIYLSGITTSLTGIAYGGFQNTHGGDTYDTFLVKFDSSGNRVWATYYGGSANDETSGGNACAVDSYGNIYLSGVTGSSNGIAFNGFQNFLSGTYYDAFLVKFNSAGIRLWATYYGGYGTDEAASICVDRVGNVFMGGYTYGSTSGLSTPNAHQNFYGGGDSDAFLVKFDSSGNRIWATYYGGSGRDFCYSLAIDAAANLYMGGITSSTNNISLNGFQNTAQGYYDCFAVKFDSSGNRYCATYFGGPQDEGMPGLSIACDNLNNIYVSSATASTTGIAYGGFQNVYGGGFEDAILVKFTSCAAPLTCATSSTGVLCAGQCFGTASVNGSNGSPPYTYLWSNSQTTQSINGLCAGVYTVTVTDTFNLSVTATVNITEPPQLIDTISSVSTDISCIGSATIVVNGGTPSYSYLWSNGGVTSTINNLCSGWYYVTVMDANDCQLQDSVFVPLNVGINDISSPQTIFIAPNPASDKIKIQNAELKIKEIEIHSCLGEKVFFQPETSNQQHVTISVADFPPGIYFITVTDQAGNKVTRKVVKM